MATGLMISRKDIVKFTSLNGNIDTDKFIQYILIAQETHIQNYLGSKLYDKIKTDIEGSSLTGNYLTLVNTYIKPMLCHWGLVEFLPYAAYTISNKGIFKHNSENAINADKNEVDFLIEKERNIAQYYTDRFVDFMSFEAPSKYPEYFTNNNDDVFPDKNSYGFSGWVL
tara:strand:- start:3143 stop:3649 length:507 start_codon:yes stop_codon:yes gene_type:complete